MSKKTKSQPKPRRVDSSRNAPAVTGQAVEQLGESAAAESHDDAPQLGDVGPESSAAQGSAVAAAFEPLPGEAPPAGFTPKILDDAPPAAADGEPLDRCRVCGETEIDGPPRFIRETTYRGYDAKTGRTFQGIEWLVVVCSTCRQRRMRKRLVGVGEKIGER